MRGQAFFWSRKKEPEIAETVEIKPKEEKKLFQENDATLDPSLDEPFDAYHLAAARGDLRKLEYLVTTNLNLNSKDSNGWQPLHEAVKFGDVRIVELLVDHGASVNERTVVGGTPLWWSIRLHGEDHPVTIYLRDKGAPYIGDEVIPQPHEDVDETEGSTELHLFAAEGNIPSARRVLQLHRHLLNAKDVNGWQPIHEAIQAGNLDMIKFLVEMDADLNSKTRLGGTALWWSRRSLGENSPITSYLQGLGALDEGIEDSDDE